MIQHTLLYRYFYQKFISLHRSGIKVFSATISTTTLINHVQKDHKISIQSKTVDQTTKTIQNYFGADRTVFKSSKREVKFVLIRDLVLLCCKDLLPFDLVDGRSKIFRYTFMNFGLPRILYFIARSITWQL